MRGTIGAAPFDLDLVVRSHGWYDLPPFEWDAASRSLSFRARVDRAVASVTVRPGNGGVGWAARGAEGLPASRVARVVRRVLDLDADLSGFHAACRERSAQGFGWIAERGAGRLLKSPSLFEDAVKVLLTTNCSWALTRSMVTNLVSSCRDGGAFPEAAAVAALPERSLREEVRTGYRAPFLLAFAGRVASGALDLSRWEEAGRPDAEVEGEIRAEKGFGPYAADTLMRLLGRHARLGLDSWSRKKVAELRFRGRKGKDARVERFYAPFGRWAGLAFWLDVTRDWHDGGESLWP
ncbi:Fe-S cluster assembly protein HesB [Acidobacteria bacterium ACD]|nr:MAG: Fe-S cluster assembly protein HesB [Acidobacteriota bacterium]MDL1952476.1 Fe-S cluster assembly protein HesB [Acidobacteria bacterium ACD]